MSQRHVEILRKVKSRVENKSDRYICNAIKRTVDNSDVCGLQITNWIRLQLQPFTTYEGWLLRKHSVGVSCMLGSVESENKLQFSRLAWIDWMIENHEVFDSINS